MGVPDVVAGKKSEGFDISSEFSDLGTPDSFRYVILVSVLNERYDYAIEELKKFLESKSEYPNFKDKVKRFIHHSIDLTYAIKTKRSFPGMGSLTRAKQQELHSKFKSHFVELQYMLKKIESIQQDLRVQDVRSTIYVVRALWVSLFAITLLAFGLEVFRGMAKTTYVVFDDWVYRVINWLFSLF